MSNRWSADTALITGATSGIGLAFSHRLAKDGLNLVLVSRSKDKLDALSQTLEETHKIKVYTLVVDLIQSDAVDIITSFIREKSCEIDCLINNAGFDDVGDFIQTSWQEHQGMLQAMLTAPSQLCHALIPYMQKRQRGYVINVGSISALLVIKGFKRSKSRVLYGAVKAYMIEFTRALANQFDKDGIRFQALCPGLTYSEFHQRSGESDIYERAPKLFWQTADQVVAESVSHLQGSDRVVLVTGWINRLLCQIYRRFCRL